MCVCLTKIVNFQRCKRRLDTFLAGNPSTQQNSKWHPSQIFSLPLSFSCLLVVGVASRESIVVGVGFIVILHLSFCCSDELDWTGLDWTGSIRIYRSYPFLDTMASPVVNDDGYQKVGDGSDSNVLAGGDPVVVSPSTKAQPARVVRRRVVQKDTIFNNPPNWVLAFLGTAIVFVVLAIAAGTYAGYLVRQDKQGSSNNDPSPTRPKPPPPSPSQPTNPQPPSTTAPPSSSVDMNIYFSYFATIVGETVFQQGTPQNAAAAWVVYDDPGTAEGNVTKPSGPVINPLPGTAPTSTVTTSSKSPRTDRLPEDLLQRFLLALFYFAHSNNGDSPWVSCNPPSGGNGDSGSDDASQCNFQSPIAELSDGTLEYLEVPGIRWLSSASECNWQGVACNNETEVTSIGVGAFVRPVTFASCDPCF
jgi:hypothetical protein